MAAVLAGGPGAVLSHASAAALWDLRGSSAVLTDVTTRRTGRARPGLRIHRPRTLRPDETTTKDGIPVTTPGPHDPRPGGAQGHPRRAPPRPQRDPRADRLPLPRRPRPGPPGHRGAGRLLATLDRQTAGRHLTRSRLERLFLQLCEDHNLPDPRTNAIVEHKEVDFLFEHHRLIVETDSWRYHKTRRAFEDDRARDVITMQAGYRTLRFTDRQLREDPTSVAAAVHSALADRRAA